MFVSDLRGALVRRWYAVLACLLLTAGVSVAASKAIHATYQTQAWVLLVPPQSSIPAGGNPYLALGGLAASAQVVSRAMSDDASLARYKSAGVESEIAIGSDQTTSAPVLLITATNSDVDQARTDLGVVMSAVDPTLLALQTGTEVRPSAYITSRVLAQDRSPDPDRKSQTRAVAAGAAAGIAATALFVALLDALILRRRRQAPPRYRRRRSINADQQPSATPTIEPAKRTDYARRTTRPRVNVERRRALSVVSRRDEKGSEDESVRIAAPDLQASHDGADEMAAEIAPDDPFAAVR